MLLRETIYYLMSDKQLNKRIKRLEVKVKEATDPREKIKNLEDVADLVNATLRKNRHDKKFLRMFGVAMQELLDGSEEKMKKSRV